MVLTTPRTGALLAALGAMVALSGAPRDARAQEPPTPAAPPSPPSPFLWPQAPRPDGGLFRGLSASTTQRGAWIGIGLACSRCSYQSEGKAVRRWSFSEPPALTMVDRGSPADQAGLRGGDTLIAVDGQTLVSAEGGEAFANLRPGVAVRLTYRRDGRERTVTVTPAQNPMSRQLAAADSQYRVAVRQYERSSMDAERVQRELERVREVMNRNRGKVLDSVSTERMREAVEQAQRALETQRRYSVLVPSYPRIAPVAPTPPSAPEIAPGIAPPSPTDAPSGGLRYSRRLGEATITARRPGRVTVVETGDSEVVLTGGDLWVRVALSPPVALGRVGAVATAGFTAARAASGEETAGIQGVVANPRLAAALGATSGVLVLDVLPRSPADSLGIRPGDVLVSLSGSPVVSVATERAVRKRLRPTTATRPVPQSAVVVRARQRRTLEFGARAAATPRGR